MEVVQRDGVRKVLDLLAEAVGQPGEAPHPHRQVLPLDVAGRDPVRIGSPLRTRTRVFVPTQTAGP
jgi:hypothetical protein